MSSPPIPTPQIYLRNKFQINNGMTGAFFRGQYKLLRGVFPDFRLVAACGERPLILDRKVPDPLPPLMHLWRLANWGSLYDRMYSLSELDWYIAEVRSLLSENQDLLVGVALGLPQSQQRPPWKKEDDPGYIYIYDEVHLALSTSPLAYLRDLNWFATLASDGMTLVWSGLEITGTPSKYCHLWRAKDRETVEGLLERMSYEKRLVSRYEALMSSIADLSRVYMYPESTEEMDNEFQDSMQGTKSPAGTDAVSEVVKPTAPANVARL